MPSYTVTDPTSGRKINLTGDSPPTEAELAEIFSTIGKPEPTTATAQKTSMEDDVPTWGAKNPNLYGAYGVGRELVKGGAELAGQMGGAALGSFIPGPGSIAGAGAGYAVGKRVGGGAASIMDKMVGDTSNPPQQGGSFVGDATFGAVTHGVGGIVGKGISKVIPQSVINKLYASSLKLPTTMLQKERNAVIKTGLKEGAVPTDDIGAIGKLMGMKGHAQIVQKVETLNNQVEDIISNSTQSGGIVNARKAVFYLDDLLHKGRKVARVDPNFKQAVNLVKKEFLAGPSTIPVADAQLMKRHIYKTYQDYYGMNDAVGAYIDGKKTIARGLKDQIEALHPEVKALNMEESKLLQFLDPYNRAIGRIQNRDIVGLGMQTAPMAGAALDGTGAARALTAAKLLDTPAIKARVSILLNQAKNSVPSQSRGLLGNAAQVYLNREVGDNQGLLGQ